MTSEAKKENRTAISRRQLLAAGAFGAAGLATPGLGAGTAQAQTVIPDQEKLWTNSKTGRRVAIINDALLQIGPPLAIELAKAGHDLVIAQPKEGLAEKLEGLGSKVVVIEGVEQEGPNDETNPEHAKKLVDAAIQNFGGFDSAYFRTALHGGADILNVTKEQLQKSFESNFVAVVSALQAVLPPLMEAGRGQVVILTSASAVRGPYDFIPYVPMRVAANNLIQCAAMTAAEKGVCVNAFGTNFLNYPDAVKSYGGEEAMAHVASKLPVGRFGEPEEAAHLAMALLDGKNMFTTGQTIMIAGGYNYRMDDLKFTKWQ
jgi:NAD(P)-dependent dehydrogenase (short-subunit alcohol dehydrogenase family)